MTFAAAYEDPPRVWGIGRIVVGDAVAPWPVSQHDIDDEAASLAPRLAALGLADGGMVLIVSLLSQAIHVVPLEKAAGIVGALYSSADATPFDAFRTASLVRQLQATIVIGIDSAVLDGMDDPAAALGDVPAVVCASAEAGRRLQAAGLESCGWAKLGPTSAFQGPGDDAFVYDETRWRVEQDDGELVITNIAERLTPSERLRTGVRGTVTAPGRVTITDW
jgi:hypothetical protein